MFDTERMPIDERHKYLRAMQKRYRKRKRAERSRLLDEMEHVTGLHRKSLARLMGGEIGRPGWRGRWWLESIKPCKKILHGGVKGEECYAP